MSANSVIGAACDTLVGGMMFHSDHADLCRLLGVEWLACLHDDGYLHDAKSHMRVRRKAIMQTCEIPARGRQERAATLDRWSVVSAEEVDVDARVSALRQSMDEWCSWEREAAATYAGAYSHMLTYDRVDLADEMRRLARDAEREHSEACAIRREMRACGWDMPHIFEMGDR